MTQPSLDREKKNEKKKRGKLRKKKYHETATQDGHEEMQGSTAARATAAARRIAATNEPFRNERASRDSDEYDVPEAYGNLDELAAGSPVENPNEDHIYRHESLEDARSRDQEHIKAEKAQWDESQAKGQVLLESQQHEKPGHEHKVSRLATEIYTISYLVLFSILGTLARLVLQALTDYPGAPVFSSVWPNFAGSLVFGFLAEDRMLFRHEWGTPTYHQQIQMAKQKGKDEESGGTGSDGRSVDLVAAKKAHVATKKTIPLYIGLATGFCGSFTSFSALIRDVFLALSNDLPPPPGTSTTVPRNGGYSFMALLSVIIITVSTSLAGLFVGAHLAVALEPITPSMPYPFLRKVVDRLAVFLSWGCWIGAVLLCIFPPDRNSGRAEVWRGSATFALAFGPLGTLARFYISMYLNGRIASFPLGTFVVNVFGTAVLGMSWDLAHVPLGGVVGCQVLQGIEDGFCGCLTTVSTWVSELAALRRRHAYIYGAASVLVGLSIMVAIMGGLRWSDGFAPISCVTFTIRQW